jgi:trehalose-6-phosphatase
MSLNYLKTDQVYEAYQNTSTRLFVVDIDLLLRPILHPEKAQEGRALLASKQSILRCLRNLSQTSGNYIFLLSSNTPEEIKLFFGDAIDSLLQVGFRI